MTYAMVHQPASNNAQSPFRVIVQKTGRQVDVDRPLFWTRAASAAWPGTHCAAMHWIYYTSFAGGRTFTRPTPSPKRLSPARPCLDYVRFQAGQEPRPAADTINRRVWVVERALRNRVSRCGCPDRTGLSAFLLATLGTGLRTSAARSQPFTGEGPPDAS